jgi:DnaJ-domain-containing protein 1
MTDYFALLDQPRRPWLDSEALKQAFHQKTLHQHPDAQTSATGDVNAEAAFAQLNEAYQTLQDAKLRIQHLLALEGRAATSRFAAVPDEIANLFPEIARATQDSVRIAERTTNASSALTRSLLTSELVQGREHIDALLAQLTQLHKSADADLQQVGATFAEGDESAFEQLQRLYVRYSFLGRWIAQLEEHRTRLQTI